MKSELVLLALTISHVEAHMRVDLPIGRSVLNTGNDAYGAMGPSACGGGTNSQWSTNQQWTDSLEWPIAQDFSAGDILEVGVTWSTSHDGHFRVELCDPAGGAVTNECFAPLERDPSDTVWSPYLPDYPYDFFIPDVACAEGFTATEPLIAKFKLPAEKTSCPHCVGRVFYQTSNSCQSHAANAGCTYSGCGSPESSLVAWSNGNCKTSLSPVSNLCGTDCPSESCAFEKFKICFDISIGGSDPNAPALPPVQGPATPVGGSAGSGDSVPQPDAGEDPVAFCQANISSLVPEWIPECQAACSDYKVWCSQNLATTGDQLMKCVMTINGNCIAGAPASATSPPTPPAPITSAPTRPPAPMTSAPTRPTTPMTSPVQGTPPAGSTTPLEYCQANIKAINPPMQAMCQGQCVSLQPICTSQGSVTGPELLSCVQEFNVQCE